MSLIVILLLIIILALAGLASFLYFYYIKINKAIDEFLEKGRVKDVRSVLFSQIEKTKEMEAQLKEAVDRVKSLEGIAEVSLQKIGVVRFNPFSDMGGNQSFAISILDSKNNGFVISSLFTSEGNRVYAKAIAGGKSDHILSAEEQESIQRALDSNHNQV